LYNFSLAIAKIIFLWWILAISKYQSKVSVTRTLWGASIIVFIVFIDLRKKDL